jgi:hypothetical protein
VLEKRYGQNIGNMCNGAIEEIPGAHEKKSWSEYRNTRRPERSTARHPSPNAHSTMPRMQQAIVRPKWFMK